MMKVLVCGDRNWTDKRTIRSVLHRLLANCAREKLLPLVIIHGAARGADSIAGEEAARLGLKVLAFPAQWDKYKRAAGPIRNKQMLDEGRPDVVIAFHANLSASKGTADMVRQAQARGIKVFVHGEE